LLPQKSVRILPAQEPTAALAADPDELIEHCTHMLAKFKVPRAIFIEADLPKTADGSAEA